jgi:hypothetical protein
VEPGELAMFIWWARAPFPLQDRGTLAHDR